MPYVRKTETDASRTQPACRHWRNKAMYVAGRWEGDEIDNSSSHCWCNLTQHVIGPDDQSVSRMECTAGRACYEPRL